MIIAVLYKFLFKWKSPSFATELRLDRKRGVRKDMTDVLFPPSPMLQHFLNCFKTTLYLYYMCFKKKSNRFFLCSRNTIMKLNEFAAGMRMYALGIVAYLQSAFNRFDCIVIFGSVFEELWINYGHRFLAPNMLIMYLTRLFVSLSSSFLGLKCTQFDGYIESEVFQMKALQVWPLSILSWLQESSLHLRAIK